MEHKKKKKNLIPVAIAIIALIVLSVWYYYLGEMAMDKVDTMFGNQNSLKIDNIIIEKGYTDKFGIKTPEIKISYTTTKNAESYVKVVGIESERTVSRTFSRTINLDNSFFGKEINIEIYAKDALGEKTSVIKTISIPENSEPVIAILNI